MITNIDPALQNTSFVVAQIKRLSNLARADMAWHIKKGYTYDEYKHHEPHNCLREPIWDDYCNHLYKLELLFNDMDFFNIYEERQTFWRLKI